MSTLRFRQRARLGLLTAVLASAAASVHAGTASASVCLRGFTLHDLKPLDGIRASYRATNDFGSSWDGGGGVTENMTSSAWKPRSTDQGYTLSSTPGAGFFDGLYFDRGGFAPGQTGAFSTIVLSPHTAMTFHWVGRISGSILAGDPPSYASATASVGPTSAPDAAFTLSQTIFSPGSFSETRLWTFTITNDTNRSREFEPVRGISVGTGISSPGG